MTKQEFLKRIGKAQKDKRLKVSACAALWASNIDFKKEDRFEEIFCPYGDFYRNHANAPYFFNYEFDQSILVSKERAAITREIALLLYKEMSLTYRMYKNYK